MSAISILRLFILLLMSGLILAPTSVLGFNASPDLSVIKDANLKACIHNTLSKMDGTSLTRIKKLKCHNDDIATLEGLEVLSQLTSLSLFGNDIKQADLRSFSKLTFLNLAKNELTTLNIQGLQHLTTLHLFKNQLTTVNFEGLTSLSKMRMMQNKLNQLDITPLVSLEQAYLWDNQLEDLQITGLDNLSFLDVKQNPMPDALYDFYDEQVGITISHDGNADDWN